jgi:anti-anti-sigma factor
MELETESLDGGITLVKVIGDLTIMTAPEFREIVNSALDEMRPWFVIDLTRTEFLDSTGLGVLLRTLSRSQEAGGSTLLANPSKRIYKALLITNTARVFKIYNGGQSAIRVIRENPAEARSLPDAAEEIPGELGWHWFLGRIYTSEEEAGGAAEEAYWSFLDAFGLDIAYKFGVDRSSWFRGVILRMKDSTALPTKDEALALMQRAIEQQTLGITQSKIDKSQSEAVLNLLAALEKTPKAVVQCGSLLIVKVHDSVVVRNLTQLELAYWERNPGLFRNPENAIAELQRAQGKGDDPGDDPTEALHAASPT